MKPTDKVCLLLLALPLASSALTINSKSRHKVKSASAAPLLGLILSAAHW